MTGSASAAGDRDLLSRYAKSGDPEAFAQLVARHAPMVYATALRVTRNAEDAQDVAQNCFLQLAHTGSSVRTSIPGWLHCVAVRRAKDLVRRVVVHRKHETQAAARCLESVGSDQSNWDQLEPLVDEALESLDDDLRIPVMLHFLQGVSQADIARELGVNQSTVSRRLELGITALRRKLKAMGVVASAVCLDTLLTRAAQAELPNAVQASLGKIGIAGIGATAGPSSVALSSSTLAWVAASAFVATAVFATWFAVPWDSMPIVIDFNKSDEIHNAASADDGAVDVEVRFGEEPAAKLSTMLIAVRVGPRRRGPN